MLTQILLLAALDVAALALLVPRVSNAHLRELKWSLVGAAGLFWCFLALTLVWGFWDIYYRGFFPEWARWAAPVAGVEYALLALLLWWVALHLPGRAVINLCLLAGLESVCEHLFGIYGLGIMNTPALQGQNPLEIMLFAIPEYILYWSLVIGLALVVERILRDRTSRVNQPRLR